MLYEEDVVEEDAILEWHDTLAPESQMRALVAPIIAWLRESDEDEEESESG
ncbi:unnamed protein product [Anisakis simplex]|uniref:W2 domain-containing protein n=1 Tax=Anisakis simplex TaxID=6269 RepID=A0A0M3JQI6_ANISI|nr:unnamed protein product [Anisakis simplex]